MTAKHKITVAIEPELLKKLRAVAASRGVSISALLAGELREMVNEDPRYAAARMRAMSLFATPLAFGGTRVARDAAHERRLR